MEGRQVEPFLDAPVTGTADLPSARRALVPGAHAAIRPAALGSCLALSGDWNPCPVLGVMWTRWTLNVPHCTTGVDKRPLAVRRLLTAPGSV